MFEKAKVREAEEQRLKRLARLGKEVSGVPRADVLCKGCAWVAAICTTLLGAGIAMQDRVAFGAFVVEAFKPFLLVYFLLRFLRHRLDHDGPMLQVVLSSAGILYRSYSAADYQLLIYRHVRSVSVAYAGKRNAVIVIRIEYKRPGEHVDTIEFVPARKYPVNARDESPLCDEIMRRAESAKATMQGGSVASTPAGSADAGAQA